MGFLRFNSAETLNSTNKTGFARYFSLVFDNLANLLLLNVLFLLSILPVFTIGPAVAAMTKVCCSMTRSIGVSVFADYKTAFKKYFKRCWFIGLIFFPPLALLYVYTLFGLSSLQQEDQALFLLMCVSLAGLILLILFLQYLFILLTHTELSGLTLIKNTLLLSFAGGPSGFFSSFSTLALFTLAVLMLPKSLPLFILVIFSYLCLHSCFFSWKITNRLIFQLYYQLHPEECEKDGVELEDPAENHRANG